MPGCRRGSTTDTIVEQIGVTSTSKDLRGSIDK